MPKCLICNKDIHASTDSDEHLIPESIGGRRRIGGLLHAACNSRCGETWDKTLAQQLHPLSIMFRISRQRGETPPLKITTTTEEEITIGPDGKLKPTHPVFNEFKNENGSTSYQIRARDINEAQQMLKGLTRKHPQLDLQAAMDNIQVEERYLEGLVNHNLSIGGESAGRSIVKSCVAMAFSSGIDWNACGQAVSYLRDLSAPPCFGYYHQADLVQGRVAGTPLHCLAVTADPGSGLILAYAEYFGIHRVVACIGENYSGPPVEQAYAIDPRDGKPIDVNVDLSFHRSDIAAIYAYECTSAEGIQKAADAVIGPAIRQQHDEEQQRLLHRAVDKAFESCGASPGEILTVEHVNRICSSVAQTMTPWFLRRMKPLNIGHLIADIDGREKEN